MPCTTILVGKKASYDGSTMIARNDDSGAGHYTSKKFVVIHPEEQARTYKTEISHLTIELPDNPMRYTGSAKRRKRRGCLGSKRRKCSAGRYDCDRDNHIESACAGG